MCVAKINRTARRNRKIINIVGDFNFLILEMDISSRQKIHKEPTPQKTVTQNSKITYVKVKMICRY